jgi:transcriptional regulator with XRE-family HTH domain
MHSISAGQIKMARALLDWSQEDLAMKTRLSISTIRSTELGCAPRSSTAKVIRNVLEAAGLEFTDGDGIKRRFDIAICLGEESCDKILDDMLQTVEQEGGEVVGYIKSRAMFLQSLGILQKNSFTRLEHLHKAAKVKCIVAESAAAPFTLPSLRFRLLSKPDASPSYFYVYGKKYVMVLPNDDGNFQFVVLSLFSQAQAGQQHFQGLWDEALPLLV